MNSGTGSVVIECALDEQYFAIGSPEVYYDNDIYMNILGQESEAQLVIYNSIITTSSNILEGWAHNLSEGDYSYEIHSGDESFTNYFHIFNQTSGCGVATGTVFADFANNCTQEYEDYKIPNAIVHIGDYYCSTNQTGFYSLSLGYGGYPLEIGGYPGLVSNCISNINIDQDFVTYDIPGYSIPEPDIDVHVCSCIPRPGREVTYAVKVYNNSFHEVNNVPVNFEFDDSILTFENSTLPAQNSGNNLSFSIPDIGYYGYHKFYVTFSIPPNMALTGEELSSNINSPYTPDYYPSNNLCIHNRIIQNAYDPNFVEISNVPNQEKIYLSDSILDYTIHFQNTGTDTAFNITVVDTLPEELDLLYLQAGASSHNYTFRLEKDRRMVFEFENILLPDSGTNEEASHAFVNFRIRQSPENQVGDIITNYADIYFDINDPVRTEPLNTEIVGEEEIVVESEVTNNICFNDNLGTIKLLISKGDGNYEISWSDSAGIFSNNDTITGLASGIYYLDITDSTNNHVYDTLEITYMSNLIVNVETQNVKCFGDNSGKAIVNTSGGIEPYTVNTFYNNLDSLFAGSYHIEITDSLACSVNAQFNIEEPEPINFEMISTIKTCPGTAIQPQYNIEGGTPGYQIIQNQTPVNFPIELNEAGILEFIVQDSLGCYSAPQNINVSFYEAPNFEVLLSDSFICKGDSIVIDLHNLTPEYSVFMNNELFNEESVTIWPEVDITLSFSSENTCGERLDKSFNIDVFTQTDINIYADKTQGCSPLAVTINTDNQTPVNTYKWNINGNEIIGNTSIEHTFNNAGIYEISVTSIASNNCLIHNIIPLKIFVEDAPKADFTYDVVNYNPNPVFNFNNHSSNAVYYSWEIGEEAYTNENLFNITINPDIEEIKLTAQSQYGCTDTKTISINNRQEFVLGIPSAITPNGDNINDEFRISFPFEIDGNFYIQIFNRWGEPVFESTNPHEAWKGNDSAGKTVKEGVYTYILRYTDPSGKNIEKPGQLTVINR